MSEKEPATKGRMANMEMLRLLSMLMVVMLHYLGKGKLLPGITESLTVNGYLAWGLESLAIVAVNVYMLISGFFLTQSRFKTGRLLELICQILFYSLLIPVVLAATGVLSMQDLTIYKLLHYLFPVQMKHYWFVSAYVLLYLLSPVLRTAVLHMKKAQLQLTILFLLLVMSLSKSVLPVALELDEKGYDALWFVCVFLCAAYIRLYGLPFLDKTWKGVVGYIGGCAAIFGVELVLRMIYGRTGSLEDFAGATYHYNHILNLCAAICLFMAFYHWNPKEGKVLRAAVSLAPCTFGVYLIHEHIELRYLWPQWMAASAEGASLLFVWNCLWKVAVVFLVCLLIDRLRAFVFQVLRKLICVKLVKRTLMKIDTAINDGSLTDTSERKKE